MRPGGMRHRRLRPRQAVVRGPAAARKVVPKAALAAVGWAADRRAAGRRAGARYFAPTAVVPAARLGVSTAAFHPMDPGWPVMPGWRRRPGPGRPGPARQRARPGVRAPAGLNPVMTPCSFPRAGPNAARARSTTSGGRREGPASSPAYSSGVGRPSVPPCRKALNRTKPA
jgi:hypothetical protein